MMVQKNIDKRSIYKLICTLLVSFALILATSAIDHWMSSNALNRQQKLIKSIRSLSDYVSALERTGRGTANISVFNSGNSVSKIQSALYDAQDARERLQLEGEDAQKILLEIYDAEASINNRTAKLISAIKILLRPDIDDDTKARTESVVQSEVRKIHGVIRSVALQNARLLNIVDRDLKSAANQEQRILWFISILRWSVMLGVSVICLIFTSKLLRALVNDKAELRHALEALQQAEASRDHAQVELLDASRRAGMAEVATGVLHNVGNVLNSVNISSDAASRKAERLPVDHLRKVVTLMQENAEDLPGFFQDDPRAAQLPNFLDQLAGQAGQDQQMIVEEMARLRSRVEHIRHIIEAQQKHNSTVTIFQSLSLKRLIDEAKDINMGSFENHGIELITDWSGPTQVNSDRHLIVQILINLISNAKRSLKQSGRADKCIKIKAEACEVAGSEGVSLSITDNGVGIEKEKLECIFQHGYTTNKDGHGFGLHSSVNAARTIGGDLKAYSDGPGTGATVTLTLPLEVAEAQANSKDPNGRAQIRYA